MTPTDCPLSSMWVPRHKFTHPPIHIYTQNATVIHFPKKHADLFHHPNMNLYIFCALLSVAHMAVNAARGCSACFSSGIFGVQRSVSQ